MRLSNKIKSCTVLTLHRRSHGATPLPPNSKAQGPPERTPNSDRTGGPGGWGHTNKLKSCTVHNLHRRSHGTTPLPPNSKPKAQGPPERTPNSDRTGRPGGWGHTLMVVTTMSLLAMSSIISGAPNRRRQNLLKFGFTKLMFSGIGFELAYGATGTGRGTDEKTEPPTTNACKSECPPRVTCPLFQKTPEKEVDDGRRSYMNTNQKEKLIRDNAANGGSLTELSHAYNAQVNFKKLVDKFKRSECDTIAFVDADGKEFWNSYFLPTTNGLRSLIEERSLRNVYWVILMGANNLSCMARNMVEVEVPEQTSMVPLEELNDKCARRVISDRIQQIITELNGHSNVWFDCHVTTQHGYFPGDSMYGNQFTTVPKTGEKVPIDWNKVKEKDEEVVDNWIRYLSIWMSSHPDLINPSTKERYVKRWVILSNDESLSYGKTSVPEKNKNWGNVLHKSLRCPNHKKKRKFPNKPRDLKNKQNEARRYTFQGKDIPVELEKDIKRGEEDYMQQFVRWQTEGQDNTMEVIGLSFKEFGGFGHDTKTKRDYLNQTDETKMWHYYHSSRCNCGWDQSNDLAKCKDYDRLIKDIHTKSQERCLSDWWERLFLGVHTKVSKDDIPAELMDGPNSSLRKDIKAAECLRNKLLHDALKRPDLSRQISAATDPDGATPTELTDLDFHELIRTPVDGSSDKPDHHSSEKRG